MSLICRPLWTVPDGCNLRLSSSSSSEPSANTIRKNSNCIIQIVPQQNNSKETRQTNVVFFLQKQKILAILQLSCLFAPYGVSKCKIRCQCIVQKGSISRFHRFDSYVMQSSGTCAFTEHFLGSCDQFG